MKKSILSLFLILLFPVFISAQQPAKTPTPVVKSEDDNVVKISTTLIQLDVVVTDKKGNPVTDLKPEDFEVYENGEKRKITNFTYISSNDDTTNQPTDAKNSKEKPNKYSVPPPPLKLKPEEVRRTYAIVVDDLHLSFTSTFWVKEALKKFVNKQMQDGDLVAIIRTGIGINSLQQFTSDKRRLLAAIEKLKWNSMGGSGIGAFDPIRPTLADELNGKVDSRGNVRNVLGADKEEKFLQQIEDFRKENFASGTLGALNYIINGMRELPGRKSVMLASEGFIMSSATTDRLKILVDFANRASVTIYTLDPRGLVNPWVATAEEANSSLEARTARARGFGATQASLHFLADETGGFPFINQNDLNFGLKKVLDDQKGYYLLGYQPDEETFDPKKSKFNKLTVKLKRDDLKVRYRSGFFGITDEKINQMKKNPRQELAAALVSPFGADELNIELYSLFYNDDKNRSFMRSLVYIDPNDLTFTPDANGNYQAKFDIIAMIFDANGVGAGNEITSQTLKFTPQNLERVRRNGIIYDLPIPIIKPGAYQFRVALQDTSTGKIGAASQFIEIPNLNKKRLTLSNLVLKQFSLEEWRKISLKQSGGSDISSGSALLNTVIRKFKRPTVFTYSFLIYNAKNSQQEPRLKLNTRLFHNGKLLMEGEPSIINPVNQTDLKRIETSGAITVGNDLSPGDYVLQVIVTDENAKGKYKIATQSIDFEIIE